MRTIEIIRHLCDERGNVGKFLFFLSGLKETLSFGSET
jgi:hypothetical protein